MPVQKTEDIPAYTKELVEHWKSRTEKMKRSRELFFGRDTLQEDKHKQGLAWFISNEPQTLAFMVQAMIVGNPPRHRIPLKPEDQEPVRMVKANVERFLSGWYHTVDECLRQRMYGQLQYNLGLQMTICGWYAALLRIKDPKNNGRWPVDVQIWDPINVFQETGNDGLESVVYSRYVRPREIQQFAPEFEPEDKDRLLLLSTYWGYDDKRQVVNGIHVDEPTKNGSNSRVVKKLEVVLYPNGEPMRQLPVLTGPVGGSPFLGLASEQGATVYENWQANLGQDVYFANEKLYPQLNEQMSLLWQHVKNTALTQYVYYSQSQDKTFEPKLNEVIPAHLTDRIEPLNKSAFPGEMAALTNFVLGEIQRGGLSHALAGQIPFELSGFAINQLLSAALTIVRRFADAMVGFYKDANQQVLWDYQNGGFGPLHLQGKYRRSFFDEEFMPDMLGQRYYVDVELKPALPDDLPQRMQMAVMAKNSQLYADRTIHDEILGTPDPDGELGRRLEDDALAQPPIRLRRVIYQLQKQGQQELAQIMSLYLAAMERQITAQVAGTGGMQATPQVGGMAPNVMPPEMGAGNPDAQALMMGRQSSSTAPSENSGIQERLAALGMIGPQGM